MKAKIDLLAPVRGRLGIERRRGRRGSALSNRRLNGITMYIYNGCWTGDFSLALGMCTIYILVAESRIIDLTRSAGFERICVAGETAARGKTDQHPQRRATWEHDGLERMDHPEGLDLERVVQLHGPLRIPEAVDYLIQAACVLELASRGIIHRDIRPGTLAVDSGGIVHVLGLGPNAAVDGIDSSIEADPSRLPETCSAQKSKPYMAPEQFGNSHLVDRRADIYSLGCTLFYVLTGHEPISREPVRGGSMAHRNPGICVERPDAPPHSMPLTRRWWPYGPKSGQPRWRT